MQFQLPEITFPLTIGTIGIVIATGHEILAHCSTDGCRHNGRLNLVQIAKRSPLGMEQGTLRHELLPYVFCPACREAGRNDKNLGFTLCIPTKFISKWPRADHERSVKASLTRGGETELARQEADEGA